MKPKIFLRKLLRGGNSIEDVFNIDSLSITDKGVDTTYISNIDLSSDAFTFNEAYVNTYYLHLSIFCYYFINKSGNGNRADFITNAVDKIRDYVKCYVLYKILKEIINSSTSGDKKEKLIDAIKSTDAFDDFDDKTIEVPKDAKHFDNMKKLLSAVAIIIKYSGDNNKNLISTLTTLCTNFNDFLSNPEKLRTLNELLTSSQTAKVTYEKTSKSIDKKMEIFEEIKRDVKTKLDEYKSKFLATMKGKDEYKLISQAKIAKVKKLAVDVIRVITTKSTILYGTPQGIANVVKSTIDENAENGQIAKTQMDILIKEFNKLSEVEKQDPSIMVIQNLLTNKNDQSSLEFSTYYYEEYLKEEIINSYSPSTGGKKRRMKKKGGTTEQDMIAMMSTFTGALTSVANLLKRLGEFTEFSEIKKKDVGDMNKFSDELDNAVALFQNKEGSDVLTKDQAFYIKQASELSDLIHKLKSEYMLVSEEERKKQQQLFTKKMQPLIMSILEIIKTVNPLSDEKGLPLAIASDIEPNSRFEVLNEDADNDSAQSKLQVVVYDPLANSELKSKIQAIEVPRDELIKAFKDNSGNVTSLVAREKEEKTKNDAIMSLVDSKGESTVELPQDLDKEKLVKMVKTIVMSDAIGNGEDFLTTDIDTIDDDLKSLAANIKSVSAIFKRLNDVDIDGIIGGTVDEAALNQLKESVNRKLNMEITNYDKERNEDLKKKLQGYEEILNSAKDITQLAQRIIDDHKKGGFRKLFYKKKRRGGDGEEAEPEDLDMPRINDLETKYNTINKDIETQITKLSKDIEDTKSFIASYNKDSQELKLVASTDEESRKEFEGKISEAEANKRKVIEDLTTAQDAIIADLKIRLESVNQNVADTKAALSKEKEELIHKIKMKVTEIEKLKVLTGNMIEKAKKILEQKEKVIDTIIREKEQEIKKIEKTIQSKEKEIDEKRAADIEIVAKTALEQEQRINDVKNYEAQRDNFKRKKEKLEIVLKAIIDAKDANNKEKANLNVEVEEYKQKLERAKRNDILHEYDLKDTAIEELDGLKFDLFRKQEELEDPKTFLKETDVNSLRDLATQLLDLNTKNPSSIQRGGGEDDNQFKRIIGSDNYIASNITIANKLYRIAKKAEIDIDFSNNGDLQENNLTIDLLCDYLILKLKREYTSQQLPAIIKELLRKFQITDSVSITIGDLTLEDIKDILENIASYISSIYLIDDRKHFIFGISLLIKYINTVFIKLAEKYGANDSSVSTEYNKNIRNINNEGADGYNDLKAKIKKEVEDEYKTRADELKRVNQEIENIDKILKGSQITTSHQESSNEALEESHGESDGVKHVNELKELTKPTIKLLKELFSKRNNYDDDFFIKSTDISANIIKLIQKLNDILIDGDETTYEYETITGMKNALSELIKKISDDDKELVDNLISKYYTSKKNKNFSEFKTKKENLADAKFAFDFNTFENYINGLTYDDDNYLSNRKVFLVVTKIIFDLYFAIYNYVNDRITKATNEEEKTRLEQANAIRQKNLKKIMDEDKIKKDEEEKRRKEEAKRRKEEAKRRIQTIAPGSEMELEKRGYISGLTARLNTVLNTKENTTTYLSQLSDLKKLIDGFDFNKRTDTKDSSTNFDRIRAEVAKLPKDISIDQEIKKFLQSLIVLLEHKDHTITVKKVFNDNREYTIASIDDIPANSLDIVYKGQTLKFLKNEDGNKLRYLKISDKGDVLIDIGNIPIKFEHLNLTKINLNEGSNPFEEYQQQGGAPNTNKPNNIFNAYIIMVMNKIMEMGETDLKDFTTKAQIAVQA